ncbi:MAG: hypothetical protein LBT46_11800 [Planctomycetaceae bacterium]|nr:hypothetical protein [Planctomycetaceae bacterium]
MFFQALKNWRRVSVRDRRTKKDWAEEIEISVLQRQYLNRCIGNIEEYRKEVSAWQDVRNNSGEAMDWQFKTENARIKLKHIYPYCKD